MKPRAKHISNYPAVLILIAAFLALPALTQADEPAANAEEFAARGAILIQTCEYEAAEVLLDRALELQPELWSAQFNRARIPLLKRNWEEARHRFEAMRGTHGESGSGEIVQYEILLTHLLAGEEATATQIVTQLGRKPESDAFRYALAALAWQQDEAKEAENLSAAARQQASGPLAPLYAESFSDVGWMRQVGRAAQLVPNEQEKIPALLSISEQP